jgi:hypothetical protein
MDFARFLTGEDQKARDNAVAGTPQQEDLFLPDDFVFSVHSANPSGAKNIISHMNSYLKVRKEGYIAP